MIWKSVARRTATVAMPRRRSAIAPRSASRVASPIVGTSQVRSRASARPRRRLRASGATLVAQRVSTRSRAGDEGEEERQPAASARRASTPAATTSAPVVASLSASPDEDERLNRQEADRERSAPHRHDDEAHRDERPDDRAAHAVPTSQAAIPSNATTALDREQPRDEQDAHLRHDRLRKRERGAERDKHDRQQAELPPDAPRVREEDLRGDHEHEPVPRARGPLEIRQVAARVLEQRPLVDHRQLEMRVGVVDRLATRLRDDDEREARPRRARARGSTRPPSRPSPRRPR